MGQTSKPRPSFLAVLSLAGAAHAEIALAQTAPGHPDRGSAAPAAAPTAPSTEPAPLPDIKDAMLEPLPPAPHLLSTWRQAIELVRTRSTSLHISLAQIDQAEGVARQAWAGALPKLTGNAAVTRHLLFGEGPAQTSTGFVANATIPDPATRFNASLDLRQPLLALGAWYGIGTAKGRIHAAELSAKDAERLLLGAVAQAAVGVITASRVAESSRVSLGSALSTLDLTRRRAQLGAASAVDVLRAEQEVALSRAQLVTVDEAVRKAREALAAALGDTTPWGVSPDVQVDELARTTAEVCKPVDSIETRSDIMAAQQNVEAAKRDRKQVDYAFAPTIDFTSSLGYLGSRIGSPNGEHVTWTVGAVLAWPLFDGGDRYGQMRLREAQSTAAREQLVQQKRNATIEVAQTERGISVAEANVQVATQTRDLAKESARLSRIAFMNGSGTSFDLVDSARRLREAEIDLLIKDFEVYKAKIAAFLARANCSI